MGESEPKIMASGPGSTHRMTAIEKAMTAFISPIFHEPRALRFFADNLIGAGGCS